MRAICLPLPVVLAIAACNRTGALYEGCGAIYPPSDTAARVTFNSNGSHVWVDFGSVLLGQAPENVVMLENLGAKDLTFTRVATQVWVHPEWEIDLFAGQTLASCGVPLPVSIRFEPTSRGEKSLNVVVTTDSSVLPSIEFDLKGRGIKQGDPEWAQDPSPCGPIAPKTVLLMKMTLLNKQGFPIHLATPPELVNASSDEPFQRLSGFPIPGDAVPAGGTIDFPIAFTPTGVGEFSATLRVETDDPDNSELLLPLTCTAGP